MTYEDDLAELAADMATRISAMLTADLPADELAELVARMLATADDQARALAWQYFAGNQYAAIGTTPALAPAGAHPQMATLTAGVNRALALDDPAGKLSQIVHRLTSWHAADETARQMRRSRARGWTRGIERAACQMCRWWEREGRIWPADHRMPRHTGCRCQQVPTWTREKIDPVPYARDKRR